MTTSRCCTDCRIVTNRPSVAPERCAGAAPSSGCSPRPGCYGRRWPTFARGARGEDGPWHSRWVAVRSLARDPVASWRGQLERSATVVARARAANSRSAVSVNFLPRSCCRVKHHEPGCSHESNLAQTPDTPQRLPGNLHSRGVRDLTQNCHTAASTRDEQHRSQPRRRFLWIWAHGPGATTSPRGSRVVLSCRSGRCSV